MAFTESISKLDLLIEATDLIGEFLVQMSRKIYKHKSCHSTVCSLPDPPTNGFLQLDCCVWVQRDSPLKRLRLSTAWPVTSGAPPWVSCWIVSNVRDHS